MLRCSKKERTGHASPLIERGRARKGVVVKCANLEKSRSRRDGKIPRGRNMKLARGLAGGAEAALALGGLPSSIIVNAALSEVDTLFMEDRWLK
jgi:hypothetical protein